MRPVSAGAGLSALGKPVGGPADSERGLENEAGGPGNGPDDFRVIADAGDGEFGSAGGLDWDVDAPEAVIDGEAGGDAVPGDRKALGGGDPRPTGRGRCAGDCGIDQEYQTIDFYLFGRHNFLLNFPAESRRELGKLHEKDFRSR